MQQPIPRLAHPRQPPRAYVKLQRLVQQPRLSQPSIPPLPPLHKLLLRHSRLEMLVLSLLVRNSRIRQRLRPVRGRGVIMAGVDFKVIREGEEFVHGREEGVGVAVGEVAPGGADVGVEEGVAAEDVCFLYIVR